MSDIAKSSAFLSQRRALLSYATALTGDASRAEDLVQEAWLRIQGAEVGRVIHPIRYLYRVVRNLAIDEKRRALAHQIVATDIYDLGGVKCDLPDPERSASAREALDLVRRALADMPERHRMIFTLYRFEGRTMQEIATTVSISVGLVHRIIHEAMAICEDALDGAPS